MEVVPDEDFGLQTECVQAVRKVSVEEGLEVRAILDPSVWTGAYAADSVNFNAGSRCSVSRHLHKCANTVITGLRRIDMRVNEQGVDLELVSRIHYK